MASAARARREAPETGAPVRLGGLRGAAHLNGEVGLVQRLVPETGRYEVLLKGGDVKAVQLANLAPLELLEEVAHWCDRLGQPALPGAGARCALARLGRLPVTVEVLQRTGVGKVVNQLCKRQENPEDVAADGRELVQRWRVMFQNAQAKRSGAPVAAAAAPEARAARPGARAAAPPVAPAPGAPPSDAPAAAAPGRPRAPPPATWAGPRPATWAPPRAGAAGGGASGSRASRPAPRSAGSRAVASADSDGEIEVPASPRDAAEAASMIAAMRDARYDETRMGYLRSLRGASSAVQWASVQAGLLPLLDAWLRAHAECRPDALSLLGRLPVTHAALIEAHLPGAVWSCKERSDVSPEVRRQAGLLLETWRTRGVLPERTPLSNGRPAPTPRQAEAPLARPAPEEAPSLVPEPKRPRLRSPERGARPAADAGSAAAPPASPFAVPGPAAPVAPAAKEMVEKKPLPDDLPPILKGLDERIARVLLDRPEILEFLQKHPSVMQNLSAKSVAFLRRNLNKSKEDDQPGVEDGDEREGHMVIVSDLHPQATEADILDLLEQAGLGPAEVTLPRESRRQRSCGVAFAVLPSREAAHEAIQRLHGRAVRGGRIRLEMADSAAAGEHGPGADAGSAASERRIRWPASEELWQFAMFDRQESVAQFRERLDSADTTVSQQVSAEPSHALFQEAARREHAEEARLVREALGGPG